MPIVRGEFFEDPWSELPGWGRGVFVRSSVDVDAVRSFIEAPGTFRRAVIFEDLSTAERRHLLTAIEGLGVDLREFTDTDRDAMAIRASGFADRMIMWGSIALASPFIVGRRLRRQTTKVFEISPRSAESGDASLTP